MYFHQLQKHLYIKIHFNNLYELLNFKLIMEDHNFPSKFYSAYTFLLFASIIPIVGDCFVHDPK